MKIIDFENWNRKEHFAFFYRMDYPQYNICANVDITRFLAFVKENKLPFYYTMIYASSVAANEIENFRYRIRKGQVVLHDQVHPSYTEQTGNNDGLFKYITIEMESSLQAFIAKAQQQALNQKEFFNAKVLAGRDDFLYITCLPWVSFTSMSHTISVNRDDSTPRLTWGKYFREGDRVLLPFSVQVHHALADGNHVGLYFEKLQELLTSLSFIDM